MCDGEIGCFYSSANTAPFERPGGKRVPVARGHREAGARACAAREEAAPDLFGRIEAIRNRAGTHSALGRLGPAEFEEADWPKGNGRPKAAQTPSTESGVTATIKTAG